MTLRNRNQTETARKQQEQPTQLGQQKKPKQQQQQSKVPSVAAAFYRKLTETVQEEKGNAEEMVRWALTAYANLLKNIDKSLLLPAKEKDREKQQASAEAARLDRYRSRGLNYSVRHISPAIQRRQRADRGQSKDLATLIEELKQQRDLWEAFLGGFKESLGSGLTAEQKEAVAKKNDDTLYEIYKTVWPILDKLNSASKLENEK
ncbi:hypothetical protein BOX15_Mlig004692g1 [Macrostomum lignano]|uniref:Uncharacterized protein n=2 Tax=Macrostomum lignano TaxID=282301 RepID=A0A267FJK0_9PLAT|nr:hypothetical protein BOX15_Mlig004692g3 [Macrostomum lignano]PAA64090.1 hypothetical protein BOX15_Mlig004692g2 [Macrostomum lignano]PAA73172.1 hypothetical protein BOX15_Mlig004692g1 [Macrostomum lignano]